MPQNPIPTPAERELPPPAPPPEAAFLWQNWVGEDVRARTQSKRKSSARAAASQPARSPRGRRPLLVGVVLALAALAAVGWAFRSAESGAPAAAQSAPVLRSLAVNVHRTLPHDTSAYTQGLLWWDGKLYESTGQYGTSDLRRLDPATGAVEQRVDIEAAYFAKASRASTTSSSC